jgi:glyceraldehyde-3-phosphate dehydrogenase (NADP+)
LPESGKVAYLHGLVADAVEKGAQVVNPNGGETRASFFYPAVLYPVTPQMRVIRKNNSARWCRSCRTDTWIR